MPQNIHDWLHDAADPFLVLATVLIVGTSFGKIAKRLRMPAVTGQILAGVLIGRMGIRLFPEEAVGALHPMTQFALGLMAVTVGAHLNVRRLRHAGRRLALLLALEVLLVPSFVLVTVVWFPGFDWSFALLLGTLAISTAPATIVALVKETRAKGVLVKTLIAAVALNNIACIFLFELSRSIVQTHLSTGTVDADVVTGALFELGEAALTGTLAAVGMLFAARFVQRAELLTTAGFIAILLCVGLANHIGYSAMLACLFLGLAQTNVTHSRDQVVDTIFTSFEPAILAAFFTLAGMELTLEHAARGGLVAVVFFAARAAGKIAAGHIAMRLANAPERVKKNLGLTMIPQAGVAVGLVLILQEDTRFGAASETVELFVAAVLTAVVLNEVVGPVLTRWAINRSGEGGHDRLRLMDFIHEENIVTELQARTMEEAIRELTGLMISSHHLPPETREGLLEIFLDRERESSTCLGGGLAVPHGELPDSSKMIGVMGIHEEGLPFDTPDGRPVHCVLLLAFPNEERTRHLQILAMLARTIGSDPTVQSQLFHARSPAHAYEVLHHEHAEDFNYFLEDDEGDEWGAERRSSLPPG